MAKSPLQPQKVGSPINGRIHRERLRNHRILQWFGLI